MAHCSNGSGYSYDGLWGKPHASWCAPLAPICFCMFKYYDMCVVEKNRLGKHLLFLVLIQVRGTLHWSHKWSSDPLSSCLMTACFHYIFPPCIVDVYTFTGSTTMRVLYILGQPIGSMTLPIAHALYYKRHHGQTMISTYHKWREKHHGNKNPNSPYSSNTLHIPGVETFIWMIAWIRGSSLGIYFFHTCHHSYLEEAIAQQGGFHLHLLSFHDVHHSGFHTWEEALEDRFVAGYLEQWWRLLMRMPQEKKGEKFCSLYAVAWG